MLSMPSLTFSVVSLRVGALVIAILLYATFSDPTPDNPGLVEVLIGGCMIIFVGPAFGVRASFGASMIDPQMVSDLMRQIVFFYFLSVGMILSALYSASLIDVIRDVVPHIYMFMPVLAAATIRRVRGAPSVDLIAATMALAGVILSVRHFYTSGAVLADLGTGFYSNRELYLSTDPTVLFAAVYLPMLGVRSMGRQGLSRILTPLLIAGGLIAMAALAIKGHRGPIGLMALAYAGYFLMEAPRRPVSAVLVGLILTLVAYFALDRIAAVVELLIQKQERVGINARDLEFLAVWDAVGASATSVTFGHGWGSLYRDPATGGAAVNFAHFSLSYALLKAGAVGVGLFSLYLLSYLPAAKGVFRENRELFFGITPPLLVAAGINGSYRFLTTGVFLCLLVMASRIEPRYGSPNASAKQL